MKKRIISFLVCCSVLFCNVSTAAAAVKPSPIPYSPEYMTSVYYERLQNVPLTGNHRADIIAIAESQIGYHEGDAETEIDGSFQGSDNYTEYGRYFGSSGRAWCSEFASWCIRHAGVPESVIASSRSANIKTFAAPVYTWNDTVFANGTYLPKPGDLALFAWTGTSHQAENLSHTAIVYSVEEDGDTVTLTVIHGNAKGSVQKNEYYLNIADGSLYKGDLVYFVAPDYIDDTPAYTDTCVGTPQVFSDNSGTTTIEVPIFARERGLSAVFAMYDGKKLSDIRVESLELGVNTLTQTVENPADRMTVFIVNEVFQAKCDPLTIELGTA